MGVSDTTRAEQERQALAAAQRYRDSSTQRVAVQQRQLDGVLFPDTQEALAARAARLIDRHGVPTGAVVDRLRHEPPDAPQAPEPPTADKRIIGVASELQAWNFLPRGTRAARTVARLSLRGQGPEGREVPHGTGFLVSPRLLLTNHHVLPDETTARRCVAEFDAQTAIDHTPADSTRLALDPDTFFTADEALDYALVAVSPDGGGAAGNGGRLPGEMFGWNLLSAQLGKVVVGEPVNVVGHPEGRLKEVVLRDNAVQVRLEDFLHYRSDTQPGSSGSPVFNDQWEVVALHHSGVPRTDEQGRILRRDGKLWRRSDGDDAIDWISNEGVRISAVLRRLAAQTTDPARRELLAGMGHESGLEPGLEPGPPPGPGPVSGPAPAPSPRLRIHPGIPARPGAFGGERHLVFLHGHAQRGPVEPARRSWTASLNKGLTEAGLTPVDPADVWFPFYGDRLTQLLTERERPRLAAEPAEAYAPAEPAARALYEELVGEAAQRAGMPAQRLLGEEPTGRLQQQLSWLAARTDIDQWIIASRFRDVAAYLGDRRVRDAVLDSVLECLPDSGEVCLVGHSLGTVVAMDVLTRLAPEAEMAQLVTAGSPLGMDAVHDRLLSGGPARPGRVARWLNVWCPTDPVALGCPLGDDWQGELTELAVTNALGRAHDITEYLSHAPVADTIGRGLAP